MRKKLLFSSLIAGLVVTSSLAAAEKPQAEQAVKTVKAEKSLFSSRSHASKLVKFYRANLKKGVVTISPEGLVLAKQQHGAGIYTITFAVDESNKKFKYHKPYFIFNLTPLPNGNLKSLYKMPESNYLYIDWSKSGKVRLVRHTAGVKKLEKLGEWLKPGPVKPNRYEKDTFVTMHVVVSDKDKMIKLYFNRPVEGEPDCSFDLPEAPTEGHFGFANMKWYSVVKLKDLSFKLLN